jgi:hypothetical protein
MKYYALRRTMMLEGAWLDASDRDLGAWLRWMSYATSDGVESPILRGAKDWPDRKCIALANVKRVSMDRVVSARLARWIDHDLELFGFDLEGLATVEAKRRGGQTAGRSRPKAGSLDSSPNSSPIALLQAPKGEERRGREGADREISLPSGAGADPSSGTGSEKTPLTPIEAIRRFESAYASAHGMEYTFDRLGERQIGKLLDVVSTDAIAFGAKVDAFIASHSEDASMSDFAGWYLGAA